MPIQDPLTQQIIGLCYRIANTLGHGFAEKVYENAVAFELRRAKVAFVQQQSVEVFYEGEKVGHYKADLIVLDEPTAALGVAEVRKVIDFVRRIKQSGRACIYIEHNLAHVHEVADRLIVLDRGRIVSQLSPKELSVAELTEYLIDLQHKG